MFIEEATSVLCKMAGESDKQMNKADTFEKLKKKVNEIRQKALTDFTEEEINEKFSDVFNGRIKCLLSEDLCLLYVVDTEDAILIDIQINDHITRVSSLHRLNCHCLASRLNSKRG